MKIDRLIGILSVLLQEEKVTAKDLAEKFEVSRRTISRDIEDLSRAGIPVYTAQGSGGGISIVEGYRMDRTLLTTKDMQMILAGLRSLDSVAGSHYYSQLMEKLKTGSSDFVSGRDSILIDLSSWYKDALAPKIELILNAIDEKSLLSFQYYAPKGESNRLIEPYYLVFKWSSWYVWGWCTDRKDFRLFKLNRMEKLKNTAESFPGRKVPVIDLTNDRIWTGGIQVTARFEPSEKWRLIEEYGPVCYTEETDGKLLFHTMYWDMNSLLSWLLTFGDRVTVAEPECVRQKLLNIAKNIEKKYGEN